MNQPCGYWRRFDVDDESTWPQRPGLCLALTRGSSTPMDSTSGYSVMFWNGLEHEALFWKANRILYYAEIIPPKEDQP